MKDWNALSDDAFRSEVRAFLRQHYPPELRYPARRPGLDQVRGWWQTLYQQGWIAPAWPREHGGMGLSPAKLLIQIEEFEDHGVARIPDQGLINLGPLLIRFGTDEQKQRYLPPTLSGEYIWCQGYSEPNAGSDLASLRTEAVLDGDEYVINGQKIWTSGGHRANQMFCLVRTDPEAPKHRGISFLLIDDITNAKGLTIRPLINMHNRHHFNEVFFEDVRVPVKNRLGEENRGWYVGMTLLDFERSGIGTTASQKHTLENLTAWLKGQDEATVAKYKNRLADHVVANNVGRYLGLRVASMQSRGLVPNYESSVIKIYQSELGQRIYNFGVNMLGLSGQMLPEEVKAPLGGALPEQMMAAVPSTIYSGSNEIQRNVIATRGLGLPRG